MEGGRYESASEGEMERERERERRVALGAGRQGGWNLCGMCVCVAYVVVVVTAAARARACGHVWVRVCHYLVTVGYMPVKWNWIRGGVHLAACTYLNRSVGQRPEPPAVAVVREPAANHWI